MLKIDDLHFNSYNKPCKKNYEKSKEHAYPFLTVRQAWAFHRVRRVHSRSYSHSGSCLRALCIHGVEVESNLRRVLSSPPRPKAAAPFSCLTSQTERNENTTRNKKPSSVARARFAMSVIRVRARHSRRSGQRHARPVSKYIIDPSICAPPPLFFAGAPAPNLSFHLRARERIAPINETRPAVPVATGLVSHAPYTPTVHRVWLIRGQARCAVESHGRLRDRL